MFWDAPSPQGMPLAYQPGTPDNPTLSSLGLRTVSEHAHLGTGPLPDHGHQVAKCSTGGRKTALRRWPSGRLYLSEGTSKGRRQGREKAAGTEVELQDKGLRAGEGLGPTDRRGELQEPRSEMGTTHRCPLDRKCFKDPHTQDFFLSSCWYTGRCWEV